MFKLAIEKFPIEIERKCECARSFENITASMWMWCGCLLFLREIHVYRNFSWFNILFRQLSVFVCVDRCVSKSENLRSLYMQNRCVITCSLPSIYEFRFLSSSANLRVELIFLDSQLYNQPSCMMGSYCALSSINRHKIYENLFENNTIHFGWLLLLLFDCVLPPQT